MAMILFFILLQNKKKILSYTDEWKKYFKKRRKEDSNGEKRAKEHYDFIREQYHKEIDNSIANTTIHSCESAETRIPQYQNNYSVTPKDSVSCLFSLENKDNVAVLNFASYKKPGGLYFQGVESQEESLCLESTLLPVIEAFKPTYYAWNNKHLNRGMYLDRAFSLSERDKRYMLM